MSWLMKNSEDVCFEDECGGLVACQWNCRTCQGGLLDPQSLPAALKRPQTFSFGEQAHHPLPVSPRKTWGHTWSAYHERNGQRHAIKNIYEISLLNAQRSKWVARRPSDPTLCDIHCHGLRKNPRSRWIRCATPFSYHAPAKIISIIELENITRKRTHSGDKSRSKCFLFLSYRNLCQEGWWVVTKSL